MKFRGLQSHSRFSEILSQDYARDFTILQDFGDFNEFWRFLRPVEIYLENLLHFCVIVLGFSLGLRTLHEDFEIFNMLKDCLVSFCKVYGFFLE